MNSPVEKYYGVLTPKDRVSTKKPGLWFHVHITGFGHHQARNPVIDQRRISNPSIVVGKPAAEPSHHSDGT